MSERHTREEILDALCVIADVCEEMKTECKTCPFGSSGGRCIVVDNIPRAWSIGEKEEVWRAFK